MDATYTIREIKAVIMNQSKVPKYLLDAYDIDNPDKAYLFDLLVMIVAAAQGVEAPDERFITFVAKDATSWCKWAILAKEYREWEELLNPLRPVSVPVNGEGVF